MIIIGIAGGTGSGKTTVVKRISKYFSENDVAILPLDAYYKDNGHIPIEERRDINFDHPNSIEYELIIKHIKELKKGNTVQCPIYSYISCTRSEDTIPIKPAHVLIVEGILSLTNAPLRQLMDVKLFVDCEADLRLMRVINRDTKERGRDADTVMNRYLETVRPMHDQFIEPTKHYADVIVPKGGHNKVAINMVINFIEKALREQGQYPWH